MKKELKNVAKELKKVADKLDLHPTQVTKAQFMKECSLFTDWDLRKIGGLSNVAKIEFPQPDKDLKVLKLSTEIKRYISRLERELGEKELFEERIHTEVLDAVRSLKFKKLPKPRKPRLSKHKSNMAMELMLSDIHYGLISDTFNIDVCRSRVRYLTNTMIKEIERASVNYNVERLIVALIGDIIQSYTMHGLESAASSEFGNAQQVQVAIHSLFEDVLLPLAQTGRQIDVPAVTGNHDRTDSKRTYNYPGLNNLTWIIYNTLELLCKAKGLSNITFHISKGSYIVLDIYGNNCLYEHGDNAQAATDVALDALMVKRAKQEDKVLHFGRFGHWHKYQMFDRGRIIMNESVCGQESYGQTLGFTSSAGQTINYYIQTSKRPTSFFKSFPVYLGHVKGADDEKAG